ncbi:hypothetical protein OpiT1DRAFT_05872 [Opitutaceae bacterium TAV1]|nr:hypothetical protein OpiT1DRAFT_05872 [Opitutaceae bacterium TAV1]
MSTTTTPPRIVIIGGGLSGTLVAVQIMRHAPQGTRITLIERHPPIGRGVAFGSDYCCHILNVKAARMSAFPDEPDHFLNWARERAGRVGYPEQIGPDDYLPRRLYGDYIGWVFAEARQRFKEHLTVKTVAGEAIDIEELPQGGVRVYLEDDRSFEADRVVLAIGNLPGEYPVRRSQRFLHGRRYVHIPWTEGVLEGIDRDDDVLLVGAGLTANDIILQLADLGHRGVVHALSRRGLRPRAHRPYKPVNLKLDIAEIPTVRAAVRRMREEIARATAAGDDWRAVIDALRPHTQALWRSWSWEERGRFLRHVRPFWEVQRHRIAPEAAQEIDRLAAIGRVRFWAGRIVLLEETENGANVEFRRRDTGVIVGLRVAKVINCTGPRTDYSKYQHPLLINLLARGLIDHDPLALGLNALPDGEVLRYRNGPTGWLFTIGAPLKGVLWESTAVPEIRQQAVILAHRLVASGA